MIPRNKSVNNQVVLLKAKVIFLSTYRILDTFRFEYCNFPDLYVAKYLYGFFNRVVSSRIY